MARAAKVQRRRKEQVRPCGRALRCHLVCLVARSQRGPPAGEPAIWSRFRFRTAQLSGNHFLGACRSVGDEKPWSIVCGWHGERASRSCTSGRCVTAPSPAITDHHSQVVAFVSWASTARALVTTHARAGAADSSQLRVETRDSRSPIA